MGIALIAVVLIFFMLFFSLPQLRSPTLIAYSYSLFGLGVLLIFLNKALQIICPMKFHITVPLMDIELSILP